MLIRFLLLAVSLAACAQQPQWTEPASTVGSSVSLDKAIGAGDAAQVEALLAGGVDPDTTLLGGPALLLASARGHAPVVQALLQAGAYPDQPSRSGETALKVAAEAGHLETVQALLAAGASIYGVGESESIIRSAQRAGQAEIVDVLRAHAELVDNWLDAARDGDLGSVQSMLAEAVNVGHSSFGQLRIDAAFLDGAGARITYAKTALHFAAEHGHADVMGQLIDAGAGLEGLNRPSLSEITPLMIAVRSGRPESVALLLDSGAAANAHATFRMAYGAVRGGRSVGELTVTPLILAVVVGNPQTVRRLIEAGANVNAIGFYDDKPRQLAEKLGHKEISDILAGAGAQ